MLAPNSPGVIESGRLYLVPEARHRLQLGEKGWKELLLAGLKVIRHGRNAYVLGDDVLRVFREMQEASS